MGKNCGRDLEEGTERASTPESDAWCSGATLNTTWWVLERGKRRRSKRRAEPFRTRMGMGNSQKASPRRDGVQKTKPAPKRGECWRKELTRKNPKQARRGEGRREKMGLSRKLNLVNTLLEWGEKKRTQRAHGEENYCFMRGRKKRKEQSSRLTSGKGD